MKVGYACINTTLKGGFRTCRVATAEREGEHTLKQLTLENLRQTKKIIGWNIVNGIGFYRLSSDLIVLATHPVNTWDWANDPDVREVCAEIKSLRDRFGLRISMHPGQYSVLSSPNPDIVKKTHEDLEHHATLMELTGAEDMILHLGGKYGNPDAALSRLIEETERLSDWIRTKLRYENDDRTYNLADVLYVCEAAGIPACFDIHHHRCHPADEPLDTLLPRVWKTWEPVGIPKIHISSGRDRPDDRPHHNYILPEDLDWLLAELDGKDVDIMVEAKMKEKAALGVLEMLKERGIKVDEP